MQTGPSRATPARPPVALAPVSPAFCAYLDLVRLVSAAMVVLHHVKVLHVGPESVRRLIPGLGHEFVVVFFVLSGYVIAATVDRKREHGLSDYALDRAARLYSVVVPALIISTLVSLVLWTLGGPSATGAGTPSDMVKAVGLNLLFVAQSWELNSIPPSNPAFWSLSYEVVYYALYGCLHFLTGRQRIVACTIVCLVAGPRVLLLLPCWLLGVAAYRWRDRLQDQRWLARFMVASPVAVLGLLSYLDFGDTIRPVVGRLMGDYHASLSWSADFAKDYVQAIVVAAHLHAVRTLDLRLPGRLASLAMRGATLTFTLYLIHYPAILGTREAFGGQGKSFLCLAVALAATTVATLVVGAYCEARRRQLRDRLVRVLRSNTRHVSSHERSSRPHTDWGAS